MLKGNRSSGDDQQQQDHQPRNAGRRKALFPRLFLSAGSLPLSGGCYTLRSRMHPVFRNIFYPRLRRQRGVPVLYALLVLSVIPVVCHKKTSL